jgi:hypothetical protein
MKPSRLAPFLAAAALLLPLAASAQQAPDVHQADSTPQ